MRWPASVAAMMGAFSGCARTGAWLSAPPAVCPAAFPIATAVVSQPHPERKTVLVDAGALFMGDMLYVGKTRELFFNTAMPDFDLKTTKFYILTRSFEHKFVREAREFDTITVKIRVADFNRKFCTLEHQIFGSDNELLGKGKQSLLFVASKDYALLDIPSEVYTAFMKYT